MGCHARLFEIIFARTWYRWVPDLSRVSLLWMVGYFPLCPHWVVQCRKYAKNSNGFYEITHYSIRSCTYRTDSLHGPIAINQPARSGYSCVWMANSSSPSIYGLLDGIYPLSFKVYSEMSITLCIGWIIEVNDLVVLYGEVLSMLKFCTTSNLKD